ncbi:MAG: hypothetical protein KDD98_00145 [Sphingomonadaceae bacterium]|nr:hypothetical protein [Sphingomonadaceae bacterium]
MPFCNAGFPDPKFEDAGPDCGKRKGYPTVSVTRNCVEDSEIAGVIIKAGDLIYLASLPPFTLAQGARPTFRPGNVGAVSQLPLSW